MLSRAYPYFLICSLFFGFAVAASAQSTEYVGENLVFNSDFSQVGSVGDPLGWLRGGWGDNTRSHTFMQTPGFGGVNGSLGSAITISDYQSGDVKWYFEDIVVAEGKTFWISHKYRTNVEANATARYTLTDGSYRYEKISDLPSNATNFVVPWNEIEYELTAQDDVASFTLFFLVSGDMTPCDGACNQQQAALNIADVYVGVLHENTEEESGNGDSAAEEDTNLVRNGSFEIGGTTPDHWYLAGWGNNDRAHVYAVDGIDGDKAARVEVSNYVNGDAKWGFDNIATEGGVYTYRDYYRADVPSELGLYYQTEAGPKYQFITWLPAAAEWTAVEQTFEVPADAIDFTVYHYIYADGFLEIDGVEVTSGNDATTDGGVSTSTDDGTSDDVSLTVQVNAPDHRDTQLTPVPFGGEYSIGRLEMIAEGGDVVVDGLVAVRIETPGALPTDVLEDVTFIDFPLKNNRPFGTFVADSNNSATGYYVFDLPEPIYVTEGTPEGFTIGAIFTDSFANGQELQLTISDVEMLTWDVVTANTDVAVRDPQSDYAGPVYTLVNTNPPVNTNAELFALVDALLNQIVEMDVALPLDLQIARLMLQIEAQELRDRTDVSEQELQQFINRLLAFIAALEELQRDEIVSMCPYTWTRDLTIGSEGADVFRLQQFLNQDPDTRVAISGPGSTGNETFVFDQSTATGVAKFQVKYRAEVLTPQGLVNPTGEFGSFERAKANELCADNLEDMMDEEPGVTIRTSSSDPDAFTMLVEENDESDEYTVSIFEIESATDDLYIETIAVRVDTPGGIIDNIIDDAQLVIDGQGFYYDDIILNGTSSAYITFYIDEDVWLDAGEKVDAEVVLTFEEASDYTVPQTVQVSLDAGALALWEAENNVDELMVQDIDGGYVGEVHTLVTSLVVISGVIDQVQSDDPNDSGTISFEFNIEADEGDVTFSTEDIVYIISGPDGTIANPILNRISGNASFANNEWTILERDDATFAFDVIFTTETTSDNGVYRVTLDTILGIEVDETSAGLVLIN